ncbi:Fc receptor-like protein 5 isoform X2 [Polypterus senegalus]|uniref:Fc receptor-like protein 5 isoform X2 n=1 Tax=Polypterus senegalus TaxID=55291 RepID=UPI001964D3DD|nr:Fc receptor-like protein 5 isoform X2 [Polypterus senegalus]
MRFHLKDHSVNIMEMKALKLFNLLLVVACLDNQSFAYQSTTPGYSSQNDTHEQATLDYDSRIDIFGPNEALLGSIIDFTCNTTGNPQEIEYHLLKKGSLRLLGEYTSTTNVAEFPLVVKITSDGEYTCKGIYNSTGKVQMSQPIHLAVVVPINSISIHNDTDLDDLRQGEPVKMHCNVGNATYVKFKWHFNKKLLEESEEVMFLNNTLIINNVQVRHSGMYHCQACNEFNQTFSSSALNVTVKGNKRIMYQASTELSIYTLLQTFTSIVGTEELTIETKGFLQTSSFPVSCL